MDRTVWISVTDVDIRALQVKQRHNFCLVQKSCTGQILELWRALITAAQFFPRSLRSLIEEVVPKISCLALAIVYSKVLAEFTRDLKLYLAIHL